VSTIDLARRRNRRNRIVWEDRPVAIRYATPEKEAAALPLRKEPKREGTLRLSSQSLLPDLLAAFGNVAAASRSWRRAED
jgi:hypothetical protein